MRFFLVVSKNRLEYPNVSRFSTSKSNMQLNRICLKIPQLINYSITITT